MPLIESVYNENRQFPAPAAFAKQANLSGMQAYEALVAQAQQDYEGFWAEMARRELHWHQPFQTVLNENNAPFYTWFEDGMLNASFNCLDRHVENGLGDKVALIFEADDGQVTQISYAALLEKVCTFANVLKKQGLQMGDTAIIYMPMSIEAVIAVQACARIGVTHSVVFGGFSAKSLHERCVDVNAKLIVTADEQCRGGRMLPIKKMVDEALALGGCEQVKRVIVYQRTAREIPWQVGRDAWMHALMRNESAQCDPVWVGAEHPLFILYTSGSTGAPKGIQHSTAGYLLWAAQTMKWVFDWKKEDVFWCTADVGWITGHSYLAYGPLAVGATQVIFEGVPTYPHSGRFWEMIDRHQVSVFYTAPTAVRSLIKASEAEPKSHPKQFDLSSLRLLGVVGEPINPEVWMWYYQEVGHARCPIVDTWWQTETGGHVIAPLPGATTLVPGSCTLPLPGMMVAIVDETGQEVEAGQGGMLVIKKPWPSMLRNVWKNPERFKKTYFPASLGGKIYLAGDGAMRDPHTDYVTIMGRIDDVLNVSGHRLGTMEVESALVSHPLVAEAAVVGRMDDLTGEAVVAFVVLKQMMPSGQAATQLAQELRKWVAKEIGPIAKPKEIRFGENLPKTRSGKIMRRLLRTIAQGETITQDISTLENPSIIAQLNEVK